MEKRGGVLVLDVTKCPVDNRRYYDDEVQNIAGLSEVRFLVEDEPVGDNFDDGFQDVYNRKPILDLFRDFIPEFALFGVVVTQNNDAIKEDYEHNELVEPFVVRQLDHCYSKDVFVVKQVE